MRRLLASIILFFLSITTATAEVRIGVITDDIVTANKRVLAGFKKTCGCKTVDLNTEPEAQVSAVLTIGSKEFNAIQQRNKALPVIYSFLLKPELPEKKIFSGVNLNISPDVCINTIIKVFPYVKTIGIIYDPDNTGRYVKEAIAAANAKGIKIVAREVKRPLDFPKAFEGLIEKIDLFWLLPDPTVINSESINMLLLDSFRRSKPIFAFAQKYVKQGAIAALEPDLGSIGEQTGEVARTVLAQKGRMNVWHDGRNARLLINTRLARVMGISIKHLEPGYIDVNGMEEK